jgi:hypothetical protein
MGTTSQVAVVSHHQAGLIVTSKTACVGRIVHQAPTKIPWTKNPESNRLAEVVSQGRSMTWGESLQCQIVRVGVSQCPTGGWRNHRGTPLYTDSLMSHCNTMVLFSRIYCPATTGCAHGIQGFFISLLSPILLLYYVIALCYCCACTLRSPSWFSCLSRPPTQCIPIPHFGRQ